MAKPGKSILGIIFLTVFIDLLGFGILIPLLPLYAESTFQAAPIQVGILMGMYSGLQFIVAPWFGRLSDRIGRRPVLLVSMIGSTVAYILMGLSTTLTLLFVSRFLSGVCGASISTAQACIADVTTRENRSRGMGMIGAAFGLGFIFGPVMSAGLSVISPQLPFFVAAALSALNAALLYSRLPETLPPEARSGIHREGRLVGLSGPDAGNARALGLAYLLAIGGFSVMYSIFPLFTDARLGYHIRENGLIFGFIGLLGAIIQGGLMGRLVKRFGELPLAWTGGVLIALGLFLLPEIGNLTGLLGACSLLAVGNSLMAPNLNALASLVADPTRQGATLGAMQAMGSLGRFFGPILGGLLFAPQLAGQAGKFLAQGRGAFWIGGILVCFSLVALNMVRRSRPAEATGISPA